LIILIAAASIILPEIWARNHARIFGDTSVVRFLITPTDLPIQVLQKYEIDLNLPANFRDNFSDNKVL
jgi:hypothetical protein